MAQKLLSDPTFDDLSPLAFGSESANYLAGDCTDIEVLPRFAVDVNREADWLFVCEFLRKFLALEWM
ncbi:hypothetical protein EBZ39_17340 [bacterium]|nr:hypothetical protein [bacterium]